MRRSFIKAGLLGAAAPLLNSIGSPASAEEKKNPAKHWIWINPNHKQETTDIIREYTALKVAGIKGILFESDSEKHYRDAK